MQQEVFIILSETLTAGHNLSLQAVQGPAGVFFFSSSSPSPSLALHVHCMAGIT